MVDSTVAYLNQLTYAVRDLPREVADGVLFGVREELSGLSETEAIERMAELGDPEFIAASAHAELPAVARTSDPAWYSVLTPLLLVFGGFIVPVLGWVVGLVLLWKSRIWTRRDKLVGTWLPLGIQVSAVTIASVFEFGFQFGNGFFSPLASGLMVASVVVPVVTVPYLLVRARRLRARPQP